jgi:hypothetical protein
MSYKDDEEFKEDEVDEIDELGLEVGLDDTLADDALGIVDDDLVEDEPIEGAPADLEGAEY